MPSGLTSTSDEYFGLPRVHKDIVKTILVFFMSLTIGLVLPNPTWAHGGGGGGGGVVVAEEVVVVVRRWWRYGGGAGGGSSSSSSSSSSSVGGGRNGPGIGHGRGNGLGVAHGRGHGMARGGGFGRGHAGVGNPGHNSFSTRSSHSQNTSHKGETHDGRSFSNHHPLEAVFVTTSHALAMIRSPRLLTEALERKKDLSIHFLPARSCRLTVAAALNPETIHSNLR